MEEVFLLKAQKAKKVEENDLKGLEMHGEVRRNFFRYSMMRSDEE